MKNVKMTHNTGLNCYTRVHRFCMNYITGHIICMKHNGKILKPKLMVYWEEHIRFD